MALIVQLLGTPSVTVDGAVGPRPRGRKAWALLTFLLLAERPPSREQLAELLFADADDPLGALRWTLAELRRVLGPTVRLSGDPVRVERDGDVLIDVLDMRDHTPGSVVVGLLRAGGNLLEGTTVTGSAVFESWLVVERHRASAHVEAALRGATLGALVAGKVDDAVGLASALVARNPLDEGNHVLLVRCLVAVGDRGAALAQVDVCRSVLRRELGVEASAALTDAASTPLGTISRTPSVGRAAALAQLQAGRAAISAGAVEAGIDCLRRAVSESTTSVDQHLRAQALVALGGALVHSVRGFDDEGSLVLHEAIDAANAIGDRRAAVTAHRELGFVEVQAGRHATADGWLSRAESMAESDEEIAAVLGVRGMCASDHGEYSLAFRHLHGSIDAAARCGDERQHAWSLSILGRAHLLRGEDSEAAELIDRSISLVRNQRWLAFLPWPQALRAELALRAERHLAAVDEFEQSWALAEQIGDPCWEGMAARGLALASQHRNDDEAALRWIEEATVRCNRVTDRYQWVRAYVLDASTTMAIQRGDHVAAAALAESLAALAARCELRELVVRAHLHRAAFGVHDARATARILADGIDNSALEALL